FTREPSLAFQAPEIQIIQNVQVPASFEVALKFTGVFQVALRFQNNFLIFTGKCRVEKLQDQVIWHNLPFSVQLNSYQAFVADGYLCPNTNFFSKLVLAQLLVNRPAFLV